MPQLHTPTSRRSWGHTTGNAHRLPDNGHAVRRWLPHRASVALGVRQSVWRAATQGCSTAEARAEVYSLGVPLRLYSNEEALDTVSNKSFACTMCGKCCTMAEDAEVWISEFEIKAIASHLRLDTATFCALYCQPYDKLPGWRLLMSKQQQQHPQQQGLTAPTSSASPETGLPLTHCVFQDEASKGCTIYPVRPLQCSTYPWWPELMPSDNWQMEKRFMCEGFDHPDAEPTDRWYAAQQLQQAAAHTLALEQAKPPGWDANTELYGAEEQQKS